MSERDLARESEGQLARAKSQADAEAKRLKQELAGELAEIVNSRGRLRRDEDDLLPGEKFPENEREYFGSVSDKLRQEFLKHATRRKP